MITFALGEKSFRQLNLFLYIVRLRGRYGRFYFFYFDFSAVQKSSYINSIICSNFRAYLLIFCTFLSVKDYFNVNLTITYMLLTYLTEFRRPSM